MIRRFVRVVALIGLAAVGLILVVMILLIIANARDPYGGPIEPAG